MTSELTASPNATENSPADDFMLEEYKTIAGAHFELHNGLRQSFRFYLGIVSLPLTVLAVALKDCKETAARLDQLSGLPLALFVVTPVLGLAMFLSMVNTRFDIVLYTQTINATRKYFLERSKSGTSPNIEPYLRLPTDSTVPHYKERFRSDWWLFLMMALVNSGYFFVLSWNLWGSCTPAHNAIAYLLLHLVAYEVLGFNREARPIVGAEKKNA